jgi:peptide/nickel transport system permease protein
MDKRLRPRITELKRTWRMIFGSALGIIGFTVVAIVIVAAIFAPFLAPQDPYKLDVAQRLHPPSGAHWFGTDAVGRDIFSRVIFGSRYSLSAGLIVVGIGVSIGSFVGLLAGYPGRRRGEWLMRITDIFLAFPTLILAIALASTLGPSFLNSMIAISIVYWPKYARLVYGQALSIRENDYVHFAELLGERNLKVRLRHVYPNAVSVILVQGTLDFGDAILFFAALSFLGLGAQPPAPDWGAMISFAQSYMMISWWMGLFPGVAILLLVLGFNFLGDALRDALDPRLRQMRAFKPIRFAWLFGSRKGLAEKNKEAVRE